MCHNERYFATLQHQCCFVFPLIETATGMVVNAIAARTNVRRLLFGTVDFCLDLGVEGDGEGLDHYRAMLVLTSRAAGLQPPVDGVTLALKDEPASRVATLRAKPAGFGGKLCVHPSQVPTANGRPPADGQRSRVGNASARAGHA